MVTTSTLLGSTFSRQRICRPRCARGDDRAGGDNALTGTVSVPCDVLGVFGGHIPVCPCRGPVWHRSRARRRDGALPGGALGWHRRFPASASGCSAPALAAGNSLPRKAFAHSLSRNDAERAAVPCSSGEPALAALLPLATAPPAGLGTGCGRSLLSPPADTSWLGAPAPGGYP